MKRGLYIIGALALLLAAGNVPAASGVISQWSGLTATTATATSFYTSTTTPDTTGWIELRDKIPFNTPRLGMANIDSGVVLIEATCPLAGALGTAAVVTLTMDVGVNIRGTWYVVDTYSLGTLTVTSSTETAPITLQAINGTYKVFAFQFGFPDVTLYKPDGVRIRGTGDGSTDAIHFRRVQVRAAPSGDEAGQDADGVAYMWSGTDQTIADVDSWYTVGTTADSTNWIEMRTNVGKRTPKWDVSWADSGVVYLEATCPEATTDGDSAIVTLTADIGVNIDGTWYVVNTKSLGTLTVINGDATEVPPTRLKAINGTYKAFAYQFGMQGLAEYRPDAIRIRGTGTAATDTIHVRRVQVRAWPANAEPTVSAAEMARLHLATVGSSADDKAATYSSTGEHIVVSGDSTTYASGAVLNHASGATLNLHGLGISSGEVTLLDGVTPGSSKDGAVVSLTSAGKLDGGNIMLTYSDSVGVTTLNAGETFIADVAGKTIRVHRFRLEVMADSIEACDSVKVGITTATVGMTGVVTAISGAALVSTGRTVASSESANSATIAIGTLGTSLTAGKGLKIYKVGSSATTDTGWIRYSVDYTVDQ